MGDIECGNCDICKKENVVGIERTYFRYEGVKCECHGNYHFELVRHCPTCTPKEPVETKIHIRTSLLSKISIEKKKAMRNDATAIFELNKGFTSQTDDNAMKAALDMAAHVLSLTTDV